MSVTGLHCDCLVCAGIRARRAIYHAQRASEIMGACRWKKRIIQRDLKGQTFFQFADSPLPPV